MNNYKNELEALLTLAEATYERMAEEQDRRMEAGHGSSDADKDELAAFCELNNDLGNLRAALCSLRQSQQGGAR